MKRVVVGEREIVDGCNSLAVMKIYDYIFKNNFQKYQ
jgi:hypothetical protein